MNIRIGTTQVPLNAIPASAQRLRELGFETVGCTVGSMDAKQLQQLSEKVLPACHQNNITVDSIRYVANPLVDSAAITRAELLIDHLHLFETDLLMTFTGRLPVGAFDDNLERYRQVWEPLVNRAEKRGVRIAFENCSLGGDWYRPLEQTMERGLGNLAISPDAWECLFDALPSESLGLCWEPGHAVLSLADPLIQLRQWVHKVFTLDGKDAKIDWSVVREFGIDGKHDRRSSQCYVHWTKPGHGDTDWNQVIRILYQAGYQGGICIEGGHDPVFRHDLEWTGQVKGLRYLKQCRGEYVEPLT